MPILQRNRRQSALDPKAAILRNTYELIIGIRDTDGYNVQWRVKPHHYRWVLCTTCGVGCFISHKIDQQDSRADIMNVPSL